ncbi:Hypothetical protein BN2458_PEG0084 [Helicobacter typhlonius]|uniref:Uncharacterized protein n=1 Tax=Helicobacter typhlonius TaxID=76936 RepID=A0A0S4PRN8_9HELI|nr:Hypothetical protein BN2458_PEG0084 [Helicobacter typhlonius]
MVLYRLFVVALSLLKFMMKLRLDSSIMKSILRILRAILD